MRVAPQRDLFQELEQLQEQLLRDLDALNQQVEQVIRQHATYEAARAASAPVAPAAMAAPAVVTAALGLEATAAAMQGATALSSPPSDERLATGGARPSRRGAA